MGKRGVNGIHMMNKKKRCYLGRKEPERRTGRMWWGVDQMQHRPVMYVYENYIMKTFAQHANQNKPRKLSKVYTKDGLKE